MERVKIAIMKIRFLFTVCLSLFICLVSGQKSSLILLGDLHYDRLEDHDPAWLADKPGDEGQVRSYSRITEEHWDDFMTRIRDRAACRDYPPAAILQAGDLSEGLAGSDEKAMQMARHCMEAVRATGMPAPWIIAKGNHDITGPGAKEAFQEWYVPMFRDQTGDSTITNASYSYETADVLVVCLDPWNRDVEMKSFLEGELGRTQKKYKFVLVHEPLVPVTERCWHIYREDQKMREQILEIIARNRAVVVCGHLHRYSVVRRLTACGPVVQVMVVSVVRDREYLVPDRVITSYGPALAGNLPEWHPGSLEERMQMLSGEAEYVTHFRQSDLPGYAQVIMDPVHDQFELAYYPAFGEEPYEIIDLAEMLSTELPPH